jgi:hypothetical protein
VEEKTLTTGGKKKKKNRMNKPVSVNMGSLGRKVTTAASVSRNRAEVKEDSKPKWG